MRHLIFSAIFIVFSFPVFTSAQTDPKLEVPDTIEEVKEGFLNVSDKVIAAIPGVVAGIWENQVIPVWKSMWKWFQEEVWQRRVKPALETVWNKAMELLGKEVEKRKPLIEQAFEQEKQELKQDIENYGKSAGKGLWERFLALFLGE